MVGIIVIEKERKEREREEANRLDERLWQEQSSCSI